MSFSKFVFLLMLGFSVLIPAVHADHSVIADAQMIQLEDQNYLLRIRSTEPQAFDVLPLSDPKLVQVRLYHARLGQLSGESGSFGNVGLKQDGEDVLVTLSFNESGFQTKVNQGDNASIVDIRFVWAPDIAAPVISAMNASEITSTSATISWITDEPSDSLVQYGTEQPLAFSSGPDSVFVNQHQRILTGLTAGTLYSYQVRSKDAAGNSSESAVSLFTTASSVFQEANGMVVMESEHYDSKIARGGQDWKIQNSVTIFSGAGYMTAGPNSGVLVTSGYKTTSPELIYKVNFKKTGTYYLWLRGRGPSTYDDSIHAGLDGAALTTADKIHSFTPSWKWSRATMDGPAASLSITSAGIHTIHLWMREDGFEVDKILLTTSTSSTAPAVTGPAESVRS